MNKSPFERVALLGGGDAVVGDISTDPKDAGDDGERAVGLEVLELSCHK